MDCDHDEFEMIRRAVAGDENALVLLLVQQRSAILAYVERKMNPAIQAIVSTEDILQQTYVAAYEKIQTFEPKQAGSFLAWLKVIASRKLIDAGRKNAKEPRANRQAHRPAGGVAESSCPGMISLLVSSSRGPTDLAMVGEMKLAFEQALGSMPQKYRKCLELRYLDELPLPEVASRLGVSEGAARGLCHRARQELRDLMMRLSRFV